MSTYAFLKSQPSPGSTGQTKLSTGLGNDDMDLLQGLYCTCSILCTLSINMAKLIIFFTFSLFRVWQFNVSSVDGKSQRPSKFGISTWFRRRYILHYLNYLPVITMNQSTQYHMTIKAIMFFFSFHSKRDDKRKVSEYFTEKSKKYWTKTLTKKYLQ